MTPSTLITGVDGFVGPHLARALSAAGHRVVGVSRRVGRGGESAIVDDCIEADLTKPIDSLPKCDFVVHLAGLSAIGPSFADPRAYYEINGAIALNVLEWSYQRSRQCRVLIVSTGAVYDTSNGGAIDESVPLRSTSPYVVSKLLVENLAEYYARRGLDVVLARPFNHIGPGQGPGFIVPDLVEGLRKVEGTNAAPSFGDLSTSRDYTDVRDVAAAYIALLHATSLSDRVYNVCSGVPVSGSELLGRLCGILGRDVPEVEIDQTRLRPVEHQSIHGSSRSIGAATGWRPRVTLDQSLADFVEWSEGGLDRRAVEVRNASEGA